MGLVIKIGIDMIFSMKEKADDLKQKRDASAYVSDWRNPNHWSNWIQPINDYGWTKKYKDGSVLHFNGDGTLKNGRS